MAESIDIGPNLNKKLKVSSDSMKEAALSRLPCAQRYEYSFMHKATVTHAAFSVTDFLVTASEDGVVKFWRHFNSDAQKNSIDRRLQNFSLAKQFKAHKGTLSALAISSDGLLLATVSDADNFLRIYDVLSFDMTLSVELPFAPSCCEWLHGGKKMACGLLAIGAKENGAVHLYSSDSDEPKHKVDSVHSSAVVAMSHNAKYSVVVSSDVKGMIEYWLSQTPFEFPYEQVDFSLKTSTDLFEVKKNKAIVKSIQFSPDSELFVTFSTDQVFRVWNFRKAKIIAIFNESLKLYENIQIDQKEEKSEFRLESFDYGQRAAKESKRIKEMQRDVWSKSVPNAVFDDSGLFVVFATLVGVKIVEVATSRCVALLGKGESTDRFLQVSLSSSCALNSELSAVRQFKKNEIMAQDREFLLEQKLVCSSHAKNRFFVFTRSEPSDDAEKERDFVNEKQSSSSSQKAVKQNEPPKLPRKVILRTTMGDIHLKLFPERCPKTVENFAELVKRKYYDKVIFHRIVANFIVQSGDPTGTGRGGTSIWGREFEDEIDDGLKHDSPGVLSMANAGKDTNGSQFFVTLRASPWLDGKHTIFGMVEKGMSVVFQMGQLPVDKEERPRDPPVIHNAEVVD